MRSLKDDPSLMPGVPHYLVPVILFILVSHHVTTEVFLCV